jgi:hypothetical protein
VGRSRTNHTREPCPARLRHSPCVPARRRGLAFLSRSPQPIMLGLAARSLGTIRLGCRGVRLILKSQYGIAARLLSAIRTSASAVGGTMEIDGRSRGPTPKKGDARGLHVGDAPTPGEGEPKRTSSGSFRDGASKGKIGQVDHFATERRKGRSVAPKYRNPKDPSQTWAGRGLQPLWVREAIKAGKKLESFLIANGMCAK